jgi:hypothetical protein
MPARQLLRLAVALAVVLCSSHSELPVHAQPEIAEGWVTEPLV